MAAVLACAARADNGTITERPLAPRAFPRGKTLFTELSPQATRASRSRTSTTIPRMWGELYHEFDLGAIGTGIAIGDYDGDGRPDIFVVTKTGGCRLYRNLGGYKFEDVTAEGRRRALSPASGTRARPSSTSTTAAAWTSMSAGTTPPTSSTSTRATGRSRRWHTRTASM
jgi:hypothetical protein